MKQIAIFGCGGFGRDVTMVIDEINAKGEEQWELIGYYDDGKKKGDLINDYPILGGIIELNHVTNSLGLVIAIGNPIIKRKVHQSIKNPNIYFPSLIYPNVIMGNKKFISIGEGTIIGPSNVLTTNFKIGNHVFLSLFCSVGHDTIIKDYVSIHPGVNISGEVVIEEGVFIGTGVKIINQVKIGKDTYVGAGALVSKSLPEKCTAVGIPARAIKFNK